MKIIFLTVLMNTVAIMLSSAVFAAKAEARQSYSLDDLSEHRMFDSVDELYADEVEPVDSVVDNLPHDRQLYLVTSYNIFIKRVDHHASQSQYIGSSLYGKRVRFKFKTMRWGQTATLPNPDSEEHWEIGSVYGEDIKKKYCNECNVFQADSPAVTIYFKRRGRNEEEIEQTILLNTCLEVYRSDLTHPHQIPRDRVEILYPVYTIDKKEMNFHFLSSKPLNKIFTLHIECEQVTTNVTGNPSQGPNGN